jgi:putative protease
VALDEVIARHPQEYCRASSGHVRLSFQPDVRKSFNRGFVADVSQPDANIDTPKSMGEPVDRNTVLHNGDGLCYLNKGELVGFRVNQAEAFRPVRGIRYFRNQDMEWDRVLSRPSAERKIGVDIDVREDCIVMTDEDGLSARVEITEAFELAHTHQQENIKRQLSKLGGTIFEAHIINIYTKKNYFIPSSVLSRWRHALTDQLAEERRRFYPLERQAHEPVGVEVPEPYEQTHDKETPVMICKYCIRRQLGMCLKEGQSKKREDLKLKLSNGSTFRLDFDCKSCYMKIYLQ